MTITTEQLKLIERRADSVPWMDSAVLLRLVAIARAALSVRNQLLNIRVTTMVELAHANMVAELGRALDGEL